MKILNLYAGIGGNRKLWGDEHEIVAVENNIDIARVYHQLYPNDLVLTMDAHMYLATHFREFDFIWSSPPCPTHSKMNTALKGWGIMRYPDMTLYEEIIFLQNYFEGNWVVENVEAYYKPLVRPQLIDRHYFWSNRHIPTFKTGRAYNVTNATKEQHSEHFDIQLPPGTKNQRKLLRNAVDPKLGLHVFNAVGLLKSEQLPGEQLTLTEED